MVCQNGFLQAGIVMQYFQVPVIAVFTKYDQFKYNVKMRLEDEACSNPKAEASDEAEKMFQMHYLSGLEGKPNFVRLESEVVSLLNFHQLIFFLQGCTSLVNNVLISLRQQHLH